jgi:hypothetical protein
MVTLLLIWLAIAVAMMMIGIRPERYTAGMPFAYFLLLSLIHAPGAAVYINFPEWGAMAIRTRLGFEQTVIGMLSFFFAVMLTRSAVFASRRPVRLTAVAPEPLAALDRLGLYYLFGGICYFFLGSLASIPSVGAFVASLSYLLVTGACLRLWVVRQQRNGVKFWLSIALLPLLPLITIVKGGFIGFGTYWLIAIACFAFAQSKRSFLQFLIAPFVVFLGLSVFVNYMASRNEIRAAVWVQQSGIGDRLERVGKIFQNFEWFDADNAKHREVVDGRLNQNLLVGSAVDRLRSGMVDYGRGATLVEMAIGLIPRALWPEKPQVGGGGTVVQDFAGVRSVEGTSIGAGQVLEFYINFGVWGEVGGFFIYGVLIGWMDIRIVESLRLGDQKSYLLWYMICLALMQPGGNLLEIVVSAAGSAVTAQGIGYILNRRGNNKHETAHAHIQSRVTN